MNVLLLHLSLPGQHAFDFILLEVWGAFLLWFDDETYHLVSLYS